MTIRLSKQLMRITKSMVSSNPDTMKGSFDVKIQAKKYIKIGGIVLFLIYISILIYFLFFSEEYNRNVIAAGYRYNFIPFKEIIRFWSHRRQLGWEIVMINIVGNIGAFLPFGLFIPIISRRLRRAWKVVALGLLLSLTVEFLQLVTRVGCCDVDDIILNTFGTMLGYLLFVGCNYFWRQTYGKAV